MPGPRPGQAGASIGDVLIRLKVNGFKNLVDVDLCFGPFTCIAGPNGAGKSNVFDAITFLSTLADRPLLDAAASVRSRGTPAGEVRRLFHHLGDHYVDEMSFEAEMVVPASAVDDLGQSGNATITFLRYSLVLGHRAEDKRGGSGLEIRREELGHINRRDAKRHMFFPFSPKWADSVLQGRRTGKFISTETRDTGNFIEVHQDRGTGGRNRLLAARQLPRTVISTANAAETPTALAARREMQSWRLLQLEPSSLRAPDPYRAPTRIAANGAHLPATLARLARAGRGSTRSERDNPTIYTVVANRLAELTEGVKSIRIDSDDRRELLTLLLTNRQGTEHEARALSDGTLRFLALAVIAEDPETEGLLCLEEPENGIHPARIPAMLRMLRDLAVDTQEPVGDSNPLRQVIVNTHSPAAVQQVPEDSLVVVQEEPHGVDGRVKLGEERVPIATFRWLNDTWRERALPGHTVAKGDLLAYLNPAGVTLDESIPTAAPESALERRVMDRPDLRQLTLPLPETPASEQGK